MVVCTTAKELAGANMSLDHADIVRNSAWPCVSIRAFSPVPDQLGSQELVLGEVLVLLKSAFRWITKSSSSVTLGGFSPNASHRASSRPSTLYHSSSKTSST